MKTKIFQIYHDEESRSKLTPGLIPYDNSQRFDPLYFENRVLLDLYESGEFNTDDYVGVVSTRVQEKTGKSVPDFLFQMWQCEPKDIFIWCAYDSDLARNFWNNTFVISRMIQNIINNRYASLLPFEINNETWQNCYCNFAVMRGGIMSAYVELVLKPVMELFETTDDPDLKQLLSHKITHRGKAVHIHPFFLEGLMGSFIGNFPYTHITLSHPNDYVSK